MRKSLLKWLVAKAKLDPRIVLLTADLGYSVLEEFIDEHPTRFLNVGVAEQNMVGVASGLAMEGLLPYTYSIGVFPTFRCAEQIRNDVDYHCLPVVSCAIGAGVAYGNLGYSHHAIQDISLMRSLPNMVIATPSDPADVERILDWHYKNPCPMYLRLHKAGEPILAYESERMNLGEIRMLSQHSPRTYDLSESYTTCIVVTGFLAKTVVDIVQASQRSIPVYSLGLWGEPAREEVCRQLRGFTTIITVEDHVLQGGLASYVMESLSQVGLNARVLPVALSPDVVGAVASESTLLDPLLDRLRGIVSAI